MTEFAAYTGLFLAAFIAATILPMQSEAVLAGMLVSSQFSVPVLIAVASFGNILGAVINWMLGRGIERLQNRPWFPVSPQKLEQASGWYSRYGRWSLLLSWAPFIGDPLTVAAGVLKEPLASFILLVSIAKVARYLVVASIALQWT